MNQLKTYLAGQEQEQLRFLRELVLQPSYSGSKQDVDNAGAIIAKELDMLPMRTEVVRQDETGNHLLFRSPACDNQHGSILLVGHMDTVFPRDSGFDSYREKDGKVFGPGVIDMKGGLVAAVFALKALHHQGLLDTIPITLLCNSDEEIGSPTSKEMITKEAQKALFGLVFECGGLSGEIVTGRKGKNGFNLTVSGRAGHAAFSGVEKASAILEMAHKIIAIEKLNNSRRQLVVNVGTVKGGLGPNTVPDSASASIDTRFLSQLDGQECIEALTRITTNCTIPGTSGELIYTGGRLPMEQSAGNDILFRLIEAESKRLGQKVLAELRSGVSDANTMASAGLPVVDGMGPRGDCDHSDREYMIRDSLPEKTLLAARVIATGWQQLQQGNLSFSAALRN
ncbi:M20 family metallopeptidase [Desulfopila sp. IMCC35008]|uniref:M20 family metallopeptidase n=1 Tax=Desulfopila sp. IMCC35008 TaxID=2653858 RepID=UPI0013D2D4F0|nr:M20 family metallopeptidase [Desulfopila sp. IMCC35008]